MDKRTSGLIATIASVVLCGCPGLFLCVFGAIAALGGGTMTLGDTTQPMDPTYGFVFLCLSLIFITIPFVVGFATLRRKKGLTAPVVTPITEPRPPVPPVDDEPLPPAS